MNTAIYTQSAGSEGVGFAMPSNTIINVYNMLIGPEHKVTRGSIGISFQPSLSSAVTRVYGFTGGGVMVASVDPNASAAKAGIKPDDIIVAIDGRPIKDGDDLVEDISRRKVGSTIQLGYLREGKKQVATVAITDRSKIFAAAVAENDDSSSPTESDAGQGKLGITVSAVPPAMASKLGTKGVVVTAIRPDSFADDIGMFKGFIIVAINKQPVTDESTYKAIVNTLRSGEDVVFVVRNPLQKQGGNSYVGGTLP